MEGRTDEKRKNSLWRSNACAREDMAPQYAGRRASSTINLSYRRKAGRQKENRSPARHRSVLCEIECCLEIHRLLNPPPNAILCKLNWKKVEREEEKESKARHQKQGKEKKGNRKDVIKYSWDLTIRLEIVSKTVRSVVMPRKEWEEEAGWKGGKTRHYGIQER